MKQIFAGLGGKNALNIVFGHIFVTSAHSVMKLVCLDDLGFAKYQSARFREEQQKEKLLAIQDPIEGLGIDILFWSETRKFKCSQGRVHVQLQGFHQV